MVEMVPTWSKGGKVQRTGVCRSPRPADLTGPVDLSTSRADVRYVFQDGRMIHVEVRPYCGHGVLRSVCGEPECVARDIMER